MTDTLALAALVLLGTIVAATYPWSELRPLVDVAPHVPFVLLWHGLMTP